MPDTCGRTSAIRYATVRPGSSSTMLTLRAASVTTPTSVGPGAPAGPCGPPQAARAKTASPTRMLRCLTRVPSFHDILPVPYGRTHQKNCGERESLLTLGAVFGGTTMNMKLWLCGLAAVCAWAADAQDLTITNARIIDGTGPGIEPGFVLNRRRHI